MERGSRRSQPSSSPPRSWWPRDTAADGAPARDTHVATVQRRSTPDGVARHAACPTRLFAVAEQRPGPRRWTGPRHPWHRSDRIAPAEPFVVDAFVLRPSRLDAPRARAPPRVCARRVVGGVRARHVRDDARARDGCVGRARDGTRDDDDGRGGRVDEHHARGDAPAGVGRAPARRIARRRALPHARPRRLAVHPAGCVTDASYRVARRRQRACVPPCAGERIVVRDDAGRLCGRRSLCCRDGCRVHADRGPRPGRDPRHADERGRSAARGLRVGRRADRAPSTRLIDATRTAVAVRVPPSRARTLHGSRAPVTRVDSQRSPRRDRSTDA